MKKLSIFTVSALIAFSAASSAYAIAGVGFHWGFDYSLSMDDATGDKAEKVDVPGLSGAAQNARLITVSREKWRSSALNFGGKAFIDIIPFIEAIEISCNFGLWQYDGSLNYAVFGADGTMTGYESVKLTTKSTGEEYSSFLDGTPYAKLQLDATVRKTIVDFWIVKLSGGAGISSHFSTPLLTAKLVEDVAGEKLSDIDNLPTLLAPRGEISKAIIKKIKKEAMGTPVYGMHILLGVKAKLPVIPVGLYIDGKYMIPFTKFDKDAGGDGINGFGLLLNAGLSFSI